MTTRRLIEPRLELVLYDCEHVLVRVPVPRSSFGTISGDLTMVELVLEDAALRELEQERHRRRCTNERPVKPS